MTKALYLEDNHLKECEATVTKVSNGKYIIIDKTVFYALSGGQPWDEGSITKDGEAYKVVFVKKFGNNISHEVDKVGLKEGDKVQCKVDWERRCDLLSGLKA